MEKTATLLLHSVPFLWLVSGSWLLGCFIAKTNSQIGPNWALTAAHCVHDNDTSEAVHPSSLSVMLGVDNRRTLNCLTRSAGVLPCTCFRKVPVSKVLIHTDYDSSTFQHDIALLKLGRLIHNVFICVSRRKGGPFHLPTGMSTREGPKILRLDRICLWWVLKVFTTSPFPPKGGARMKAECSLTT